MRLIIVALAFFASCGIANPLEAKNGLELRQVTVCDDCTDAGCVSWMQRLLASSYTS